MDIIDMLTHFNLTKQEATIYKCLLTGGEQTGYEIAKLTGISRSNIYIALAGLVEKGAAYVIEGSATKYMAVHINEFCDNQIREMQKMKQSLVDNMPPVSEEPEGYITIKGENHILNKMKNMLLEAKERVYLSMSGPPLQEILPQLKEALAKNLKVVIITSQPFQLKGAKIYYAEKTKDQIRMIVDSQNVLVGEITDSNYCTCLYSRKQNLIDLIKESLKNEIQLIELLG